MATRIPVTDAPVLPTRLQWSNYVHEQSKADPKWIPPNQVCVEDVEEWAEVSQELALAKSREALLRSRLFKFFFEKPREGTNKVRLVDGRVLEATHKVARDIDEAKLEQLRKYRIGDMRDWIQEQLKIDVSQYPDDMLAYEALQVSVDGLVKLKPTLNLGAYRELTAERALFFNLAVEVKDATPQMKLTQPKGE